MTKDGWHNLYDYAAYTKDGIVMYCNIWDAFGDCIPAKPFKWDQKAKKWVDVSGKCTLNALYGGLKRDTYAIL